MEKRLSYLSHKCLQINTIVAEREREREREMMYEYADKCFENLLEDFQEMRKKMLFILYGGSHRGPW